MRRTLITGTFLLSMFLLALPSRPFAQQATTVWVDANGNVHSSPPEQLPSTTPALNTSGYVSPAYTAPVYVPPASRTNPGAPAYPADRYAQWQDPAEGAFSVSLPAGWHISGGTVRGTRIEAHYVVRAQPPDGGVRLFMDDPSVKMREVPNGSITNLVQEPYRPGDQFATEYVQQSLCPSATNMHGGPLPNQTQALNLLLGPIAQAEGKTLHADAGEVSFRCGKRTGYVYAITVQSLQPGGGVSTWAVYRLAGYLATSTDTERAAEAINQALGTFQMNQVWLAKYARECCDIAGNVIRESNAITQTTIERELAMNAALEVSIENARRNAAAGSNAIAESTSPSPGSSGNGHNYNAELQNKKVCDNLDRCQTVSAEIDNWYSDCSGTFYPGPASGGPPPDSLSACWSKGH